VAVGEPTSAEREYLHSRSAVGRGDADHVDGPDRPLVRRLAFGEMADGDEAVAHAGRFLEILPLRGGAHPIVQLIEDRLGLPGEEVDDPVDDLAVVLLGDVGNARGQAAVDVVVEAGNPRMATRLGPLAGPEAEHAIEDVESLPHLLRVCVRAEVDDAAAMALAREHHPREVVVDRDGDVRIGLVVAQTDVERWPMALDEVLLEVKGLRLGARDDDLDAVDAARQAVESPARVACAEIRTHPRPKGLRLADVEDRVVRGTEQVDTGLRRECLQLRLDALAPIHGRSRHAI
jgi:hypothetical protein